MNVVRKEEAYKETYRSLAAFQDIQFYGNRDIECLLWKDI